MGHLLEQIRLNLEAEADATADKQNVLRRSTLFLDAAKIKMSPGAETQAGHEDGKEEAQGSFHTNELGHLVYSNALPPLGRGYHVVSEIGQGTFSRIFKSTMPSSSSYVAIKASKVGFQILGFREACFLRYFASKTPYGSRHFLGLIDTFEFEGHHCLALELCKATLVDYIALPEGNKEKVQGQVKRSKARNAADSLQGGGGAHQHRLRAKPPVLVPLQVAREMSTSISYAAWP